MPNFYRFINNSERRQCWSILSFQIILMALSWYYIEHVLLNDECYTILKRDYYSGSLYIDVPDICRSWTLFWFRTNHYTIHTIFMFVIYVVFAYDISTCHTVTHVYTCTGLMLHCFITQQQDYIVYYQGPILLHLLVLVLYLEKQPFEDQKMRIPYSHIRAENNKRSIAQTEMYIHYANEVICKMRQCANNVEIEEVMRQADEQLEKDLLRCQFLNYPVLTPPEQKKNNIILILFIHVTSFLLILLAVWSIVTVFHRSIRR